MKPIELRAAAKTRLYRIAIPLVGAVMGGLLWRLTFTRAEIADQRTTFAVFALVACVFSVWATFAWRRCFVVGSDGVTKRTAFRTRRLAWDEIDGVVHGYFLRAVLGTAADRRRRLGFDGSHADVCAVVDAVLAQAPKLHGIAWGLGLDGVARPRARPALLPERLQVFDKLVEIRGPGRTYLRIGDDRPDYAQRVECARERLARLMLGEDAG